MDRVKMPVILGIIAGIVVASILFMLGIGREDVGLDTEVLEPVPTSVDLVESGEAPSTMVYPEVAEIYEQEAVLAADVFLGSETNLTYYDPNSGISPELCNKYNERIQSNLYKYNLATLPAVPLDMLISNIGSLEDPIAEGYTYDMDTLIDMRNNGMEIVPIDRVGELGWYGEFTDSYGNVHSVVNSQEQVYEEYIQYAYYTKKNVSIELLDSYEDDRFTYTLMNVKYKYFGSDIDLDLQYAIEKDTNTLIDVSVPY